MTAPILSPDADAIARAAETLRAGGLVGLPTETVYGLAVDAANGDAVARAYEAKGRPRFNPLIAHVAGRDMAAREGAFSHLADRLAEAFWPGPLTLVLPLASTHSVCDLARAGLGTIALRAPAHAVARTVIDAFGGPIAAPSANPSGRLSPTAAAHVAADLGDKLDIILDGGRCAAGLESTVVDCTGDRPALLRLGAVAIDEIEAVSGALADPEEDTGAPRSPGRLLRHYAPAAALRLNAEAAEPGEAFLGFGNAGDLDLSPGRDLREAAANLFAMLRELDGTADRIAVAPIPTEGLGAAINDRLIRAAERS
ncbi:MAG: L-threonylcarbamoyladenylate synthase [Pseudomonadota bacterium]